MDPKFLPSQKKKKGGKEEKSMEPSKQCKFKDSLCKLLLKLFNTSD